MISGIWANSNYDDTQEQKGVRDRFLAEIETKYKDALKECYRKPGEKRRSDIDWDDPFFAASKAPRIGFDPNAPKEPERPKTEQEKRRAEMEVDQA